MHQIPVFSQHLPYVSTYRRRLNSIKFLLKLRGRLIGQNLKITLELYDENLKYIDRQQV